VLTEIILNKACKAVHRLVEQGFDVSRVSVNVSVQELRDDKFCDDITRIIRRNDLEGEKIAIELTESMTDDDFILMKNKISELRQKGIKFYLDDFGTGYSNMERIMELPFDIIKFDRSMVLASEASERSRTIVLSLANMFDGLNYSVLYEGVEKESDEQMCIGMSASYLQGYKYSRPLPIERLQEYFSAAA
jgi:EAL domain-containing protein (putative c-di-GMP-specific phosphodiesterase class I)